MRLQFRQRLISFRCVIGGSLAFTFSTPTCRPYRTTFPASLTTTSFERSSTRWFGICPCRPTPRDLPPSSAQFGGLVSAFVTHHLWESSIV